MSLLEAIVVHLASAAPIIRNETRSAPMKITAPQAARDCKRALLQLKKDNVAGFVVEWCNFEGSPDFSSLNASHSVSVSIVAERVLGDVALTCWGSGQDPEYALTCGGVCLLSRIDDTLFACSEGFLS